MSVNARPGELTGCRWMFTWFLFLVGSR